VDVGASERAYTVEPLEDPVPRETPQSPAERCEPEQEPEPETVESG
jgi:hypothetical protein